MDLNGSGSEVTSILAVYCTTTLDADAHDNTYMLTSHLHG